MSRIPFRLVLDFYWQAKTIFSAHSPFVYQFMKEVMGDSSENVLCNRIEMERKRLLNSKEIIPFIEYGAGSSVGKNDSKRKLSDVAKNSLSGKWQCQIMHNLVKHFELESILEIGTSLGISTAYLSAANSNSKIITLEGNPDSVTIAKGLWTNLKLNSIEVKVGEFGETMNEAINEFESIDLAFLDGNHKKQATIDYFNLLKKKSAQKSVFVIDDIYWSKGMNEAWNEIIEDESVAFSMDLFRMGIVFFDHTIMPKQHFKLIPYWLKPWAVGLFG